MGTGDDIATRRAARRRAWWLAGTMVLAAVGVWLLIRLAAGPSAFVLGILPIDGQRTLVTLRANESDTTRGWIALVDVAKGPVWFRELPGPPQEVSKNNGLSLADGLVTVRVAADDDEGGDLTVALDVANGRERWRSERAPAVVYHNATFADVDRVYEMYYVGEGSRIQALDRHSGATLWDVDVGLNNVVAAYPVARGLLWSPVRGAWRLLDAEDGRELAAVQTAGSGACFDGKELVYSADHGLYALDVESATTRAIRPAPERPEDRQVGTFLSCGRRPDVWVALQIQPRVGDYEVAAFARGTGELQWRIPLGEVSPVRSVHYLVEPGTPAQPLAGELPAVVTELVNLGGREHRLLTFDLEAGRLLSSLRVSAPPGVYRFTADGATFVGTLGHRLGRIGPDGRPGPAVEPTGLGGDVLPQHVIDGRIWLHSPLGVASLDEHHFAVLDASSLELVRAWPKDSDVAVTPAPVFTPEPED